MVAALHGRWVGLCLFGWFFTGGLGELAGAQGLPPPRRLADTQPPRVTTAALPGPGPAVPVPPPDQSANGIDGRIDGPLHTVVIVQNTDDTLAVQQLGSQVTKVLATPPAEVWARATDAQVAALGKQGTQVSYRDGVDLMHCFDVRRHPTAPRQLPPPPFHNSSSPSVFLVQLDVPTTALPGFMDVIATRGLLLLQTEEATLTIRGSAAAIAKLPHVLWTGPYGVRERVLMWALDVVGQQPAADAHPGCGWAGGNPATVDRILRRLGSWIAKAPTERIKLAAVLFQKSRSFEALVRQLGGSIQDRSDESMTITIPRKALPELAAHPDLRELGQYAVASTKVDPG